MLKEEPSSFKIVGSRAQKNSDPEHENHLSQNLVFENGRLPNSEGRQNQNEVKCYFFLYDRNGQT